MAIFNTKTKIITIMPPALKLENEQNRVQCSSPEHSSTTIENAQISTYDGQSTAKLVSVLSELEALPEIRPIPWIEGKELPPEKSTESLRTQTRGGYLLSTRGNIQTPPCTRCATGGGQTPSAIKGRRDSIKQPPSNKPQASNGTKRKQSEMADVVEKSPMLPNVQDPIALDSSIKLSPNSFDPSQMITQFRNTYQSPYTSNNIQQQPQKNLQPVSHTSTSQKSSHTPSLKKSLVNVGTGQSMNNNNGGTKSQRILLSPTPPIASTNNARAPIAPTERLSDTLFDNLPRKKQKQIFGIIGGIQSGIRIVRQQADQLQNQLDLLQSALGIDSEDGIND
ncbi:hypothetical protein GLAREA_11439 [Glarea lozoyensis ATCC 20868]|uniref:Uncharacterized protein n=1 Tax=Glarea lozoyensis (strain ATCC 20868 / MF5171) TaxID=1116229 RepID=S3DDZ2_GLAL2|nr:uncharacterized protein GLAREA_11439 [Glarea lozoyensis ATCC 20868]EPE24858.1 hypothetical protein GLAREA_11439 [Glarea lozoyensis ATCC 20868]